MTRPIRALIRRSAFRRNLAVARTRAPDAKHIAVIKANAYGHGLLRAARALEDADGFAVLDVDAAVRLRNAGFQHPVLLLEGFFDPGELGVLSRHGVSIVVHNMEQLKALQTANVPAPLPVFLKINSGMNRLGFPPDAAGQVARVLRACPAVRHLTLMTHFANADDAVGIDWQLERFQRATEHVDVPLSMANSATVLRYPAAARGWTRIGLMLYGASPFEDQPAAALGLQPAMTLESRLIAVRDLAPGERIGYGGLFTADQPLRMGVVACGYADGYPRHAPTGTPVLVEGVRTRTLGRVSMDMLCVDVSDVPQARLGSRVVLWGDDLPVEEIAASAGTVAYQLLCGLAPRVPVVDVE
ncbi:MAG TPA: alanine racemase [Burkholderiales bacterium]|nr:alanine racemase [Burkholderiales bacterium]